jgi:putative nucleotidyltransferase with HDIG domain
MTSQPLTARINAGFAAGRFHLATDPAMTIKAGATPAPTGSSALHLAELMSRDPALVCNLFRAANSAFYQGLPKVRTLGEAITRIGEPGAADVVARTRRDGALSPGKRFTPRYQPPLWQHSVGCALGASWLADRCGYRRLSDQAYLAGLLHDIGKWLLLAILEQFADDGESGVVLADQLFKEVLESMHVELGMRLATEWNFPDDLTRVIAGHHQSGLDSQDLLVSLVKLANQGCRKIGLGWDHDPDLVLPTTAEAQALGINELALAEYEIMLEDYFGLTDGARAGQAVSSG